RRRSVTLHAIVTSPYVRARDTGTLLAGELGVKVFETSPLLSSRGTPPPIEPLVEKFRAGASLLLVGHQPDMGMLASALCGASVSFSTAAVAAFDWTDPADPHFLWSICPTDLPVR